MPKRHLAFGLVLALGVISLIANPSLALAKNNQGAGGDKVTICHATNSQSNPYVKIEVSTSAVDERHNKEFNGHGDHEGSVWHEGIANHSWGDIIPSFVSAKGAHYPGQNMTEAGKTILQNGCKIVKPAQNTSTKPEGGHNEKPTDNQTDGAGTTKPVDNPPTPVTPTPLPAPAKPAESAPVKPSGDGKTADAKPADLPRELPQTGAVAAIVWLTMMGLGGATYLVARSLQKFAESRAN